MNKDEKYRKTMFKSDDISAEDKPSERLRLLLKQSTEHGPKKYFDNTDVENKKLLDSFSLVKLSKQK
ncbi:hypothetical protein T03_5056 [Trichinella britovi]|uniref:Uncharacterized protein n=1 Tax=Trichinella britovi TaxID=45882 RepID=A0A0V1CSH2_TRIBR|nr:hypothetical protein T03_5056 [Trichinella britovi]